MGKTTDAARVECNFCEVEHMQGNCLNFDTRQFDKWIHRHGMLPKLTFHKDVRDAEEA